MREEFSFVWSSGRLYRITPAHAGRIIYLSRRLKRMEDHPRACGKNLRDLYLLPKMAGSPPRMREELEEQIEDIRDIRITPAHAGRIKYVNRDKD